MTGVVISSLTRPFVAVLALATTTTALAAAPHTRSADLDICTWTRHGSPYPLQTRLPACPLPLDSRFFTSDTTTSYLPWSAPPLCPDLKPSSSPPSRHKPAYKPCLYQSTSFRNGAGLALLTTPKLAASVAGSALDDSLVPLAWRAHPSSSLNSEYANVMYVSYDVRDVPGKGKGVVARRRIGPWDTVLVDSALLVVPGDFGGSGGKDARRKAGEIVRMMVGGLPEHQRREVVREIAGVKAAETEAEGNEKLLDVLRTHGFGVEIEEVLHTALFPLASVSGLFQGCELERCGLTTRLQRVNHDCKPK